MKVSTYWWRARPNFGDALAPLLLRRFSHHEPVWADRDSAELFTIGSVLEGARNAVVLGSGKLYEETVPSDTNRYLAVRGPLTGVDGTYGDPGLLAPELVTVGRKTHQLGLVPHWSDRQLFIDPRFTKYNPMLIDPAQDPLDVVRQIGSCHKIVTSSLHGAVIADAFNIPRRTEIAPRLQSAEGGMFKFRDYNMSVGVESKWGVTQRASLQDVETIQHLLYDIYQEL
jgi:pyruvyltransferase